MDTEATQWPMRMATSRAADYLTEVHGLPITEKTLRNKRAARRGPGCRYLGTLPLYDRAELDRWAAEDALAAESPVSATRRRVKEARESQAA